MYIYICIHTCIMYHCNNNLACSVMSKSLQPYGLEPAWLLCPWAFSGEDEWVAMPSSRRLSQPRDPTLISYVSCIARRSLPLAPPGKPTIMYWDTTCTRGCDTKGFIPFYSNICNVWRVTIGKFIWSKLQMKILGLRGLRNKHDITRKNKTWGLSPPLPDCKTYFFLFYFLSKNKK